MTSYDTSLNLVQDKKICNHYITPRKKKLNLLKKQYGLQGTFGRLRTVSFQISLGSPRRLI